MPATGPKWLVGAGFDRALIEEGWFAPDGPPRALLGASAGSWRALAFASRDPGRAHAALVEAYCRQRFTRDDRPPAVSDAYRRLIAEVYTDEDLTHAVAHPSLDLAITTVRARLPFVGNVSLLRAVLGSLAVLNAASSRSLSLAFDRVVFHARAGARDAHPLLAGLVATRCPLTERNARAAALASGTVPFYMEPVAIPDAPTGPYLDGGLSDYHVSQRLVARSGVVLLFLHQRKVLSGWLDKLLPWRAAEPSLLDDVLLVYPDPSFVRSLPGGEVPTREDFHRMMSNPDDRTARWLAAADASRALGDEFLEDLGRGSLAERVESLA